MYGYIIYIKLLSLIIFFILSIPWLGISQDEKPERFCISQEEFKLFKLINDCRKDSNLLMIPLSKSLCYVAKMHSMDLIQNKPDTNSCNFHSWSDKGQWSACCFSRNTGNKSCMSAKPKELTNYPGIGYEIVYWENKKASAGNAFSQWRETGVSCAMLLNNNAWENYAWNALGLSIEKGYAILWMGELRDAEAEIVLCETNEPIVFEKQESQEEKKITTISTGRFYIIYGSYKLSENVDAKLAELRQAGFPKAKILSMDEMLRITLSDYESKELAIKALKELPSKYKGAWIMAF